MTPVTGLHVAAGLVALVAGAAALVGRKGASLHARAGSAFVAAMLVLALTASSLDVMAGKPASAVGGVFTCYLVATSWATARRRDGVAGRPELVACAVALGAAVLMAWSAFSAVESPTPVGRGPVIALAVVCLLAGLGDLNAIVRVRLTPVQRISRHLWRMCIAFFIATGSFFLGQQDVMPLAVRGSPVLFVLGFAPFAALAFWVIRVRFGRRLRKPLDAAGPRPLARP